GMSKLPGVEVAANPPDLAEHYAWADLAVVPVHAGGGTRIKLLEAFAYGVPVVATRLGAAGIAAEERIHLLLAESPKTFVAECAEMLSDARLRPRLSASARELVEARYTQARAIEAIREAARDLKQMQQISPSR